VATAVATAVAFVVGYASIAFLLRLVASHKITAFVPYRVLLGIAVLVGVAVHS
jgi:undecaprenyl-diphosphatase